jgi:hypothetical protein
MGIYAAKLKTNASKPVLSSLTSRCLRAAQGGPSLFVDKDIFGFIECLVFGRPDNTYVDFATHLWAGF